jgi:hypothetical protein
MAVSKTALSGSNPDAPALIFLNKRSAFRNINVLLRPLFEPSTNSSEKAKSKVRRTRYFWDKTPIRQFPDIPS